MSFELTVDMDGDGELETAFAEAPEQLNTSLWETLDKSAAKTQRDWRAGARKTAGRHGKHYPSSITHALLRADGAIWSDIGPETDLPQGGMGPGFEYGSVNTAPHPDMAVAFATNAQDFSDAVAARVDEIIRGSLL